MNPHPVQEFARIYTEDIFLFMAEYLKSQPAVFLFLTKSFSMILQ